MPEIIVEFSNISDFTYLPSIEQYVKVLNLSIQKAEEDKLIIEGTTNED